MVSSAWFAHTWKLAEKVKVAMDVRRNFSKRGNVEIFLIFFRLLSLQCKLTFTKHFTASAPQRKFPMKARAPFASILKSFGSGALGYRLRICQKGVLSVCHVLLNWRIKSLPLWTNESHIGLNYQQLRLRLSHLSALVEQISLLKSFVQIVFYTSAIRNAFAFHELRNIHLRKHFLQTSHN